MQILKLKSITPIKKRYPEVGDVILGEHEFTIGRTTNRGVIEVGVTREQCKKVKMVNETMISKNKLFSFKREKTINNESIDYDRPKCAWVVTYVEYRESVELLHSILPESYLVRANRLINNEITDESETIEFYTCGIYENIVDRQFEIVAIYDLKTD